MSKRELLTQIEENLNELGEKQLKQLDRLIKHDDQKLWSLIENVIDLADEKLAREADSPDDANRQPESKPAEIVKILAKLKDFDEDGLGRVLTVARHRDPKVWDVVEGHLDVLEHPTADSRAMGGSGGQRFQPPDISGSIGPVNIFCPVLIEDRDLFPRKI